MDTHSYHHRKKLRHRRRWHRALLGFIVLILIVGGLIGFDLYRGRSQQQTGTAKISELVVNEGGPKITIDEPSFLLQLPGDWKETGRVNSEYEYGITWQSTKPKFDNRFMTVYVDKIPLSKSFNRLLPIEAVGSSLRHGTVSDNCAAYTEGGSIDANSALAAKDTPAKWEEVTFLCDLPKVFDNVVGTSSKEGVNTVTVSGPQEGKHRYFFIYTDHNIHPDYEIFTTIVKSFKAK